MKVLVVDDETDFLEVAKLYLERAGDLEVDTLSSPEEAFEEIENTSYDAIISDFKMPEIDGLTLLKKIRDNDIDIPFFIFTAKGEEKVAQKALNLGANGYFNKSKNLKKSFKKLAKVLTKSANRHKKKGKQETLIAWIEKKKVEDIDPIKYDLKKLADKVGFKVSKFTKQDISHDKEIIKMYTKDIDGIPMDKIDTVKDWKKKESWSSEIIKADAKFKKIKRDTSKLR